MEPMSAALLAVVAAVAHAAPDRARGLTPARSTAEALTAALAPRRVALVVGVDAYDDPAFPWLQHAGHDADLFAGVLRDPKAGGFDQVVALAGSPTRDQVLAGLREVTRDLRREDVLVVYFSGHGTRVLAGGDHRYLLARDSRAASLDTSAIELEALQTWFNGLPVERKVLIVDACFDGNGKSVLRPTDRAQPLPLDPGTPSAAGLGAGEAYLFATSPGRPALEDDQLGHGLYSYFLIEALSWSFAEADRDGDGVVTAWEAHDHARTRVLAWSDGVQVPEASLRVVGTADLVLAGSPGARRVRDQALVYLYAPESDPLAGGTLTVDGRPRGVLPGTIPVAPGRHHFELADNDGVTVADGFLDVVAGRPYRADDLVRLLQGPAAAFGVRPVVSATPELRHVLGPAFGAEAFGYLRDDEAPGRGWWVGGRLGWLDAPARLGPDDARIVAPRHVVDGGAELGVQNDWRRLRYAVGATAGAVWIPPDPLPDAGGTAGDTGPVDTGPVDPYAAPSEAGWLFFTAGPTGSLSFVLSEAVTVGLFGRAQLSVLDVEGQHHTEAVPWMTSGLSVAVVAR